jgi:hypothetical protein
MTVEESKALQPGDNIVFMDSAYDIVGTVLNIEEHYVEIGYHGSVLAMHRHEDMQAARKVIP